MDSLNSAELKGNYTQEGRYTMFKNLFITAAVFSLVACGSSSSKDDSDTPTTTTSTTLSSQFASACSSCHGSDGTSTTYKKIKGTTLTEAQFKSVVRDGKGSMAAVGSGSYSDASLSSDYALLKQ